MKVIAIDTTEDIVGWGTPTGLKSGFTEYVVNGAYTGEETNISQLDVTAVIKEITKLVILDRLDALGKAEDAVAILELPQNKKKKYRWDCATIISIDDTDVIAIIEAVGVDPAVILY